MSVTLESPVFMGKNYSEQLALHQEHNRSHNETNVRHICKISVWTRWNLWSENNWLGKSFMEMFVYWLVMNRVINLQRTNFYVFDRFCIVSCGKIHEEPSIKRCMGTKIELVQNYLQECRDLDRIDGEPMEFQWNISPGYNTLQLNEEVKSLLLRLDETPENFTGRIIFMSMFNDISCGSKDNEKECLANAKLVSLYAKRFGKGQWSFIGPGSEKKWYCISEDSPQGVWDNMAERMLLEFAESGCPIFRATSPLSRGRLKSKGHGKLSIHYSADLETIETIFRIIVSANQLSLYGGVAEKCAKSTKPFTTDRGRPVVRWGNQVPHSCWAWSRQKWLLDCDDLAKQGSSIATIWRTNWKAVTTRQIEQILYGCRISEHCWRLDNTSWRKTLQNSHNFVQWPVVSTLFHERRKEGASQPKGWIQGNTKDLGSYWKLKPVTCMVSTELRSELCLWTETILTPGSEFLMDQTSLWWFWTTMRRKFQKFSSKNMRQNWMRRILHSDQRLKQNHKEENLPALPQEQFLLVKRTWTDVEPSEIFTLRLWNIEEMGCHLLRHWTIKCIEKMMERFNSGELKKFFRNISPYCPQWSDSKWKSVHGRRKRKQEKISSTVLILQE